MRIETHALHALACLALASVPASAQSWCWSEEIDSPISDPVPVGLSFAHVLDSDGETLVAMRGTHVLVYEVHSGALQFAHDLESASAVPGGYTGDYFGFDVAISGDTFVVGAPLRDSTAPDAGAVFVFERQGGIWSEVDELVPAGLHPSAQFGSSVAIEGDRLLVGSPTYDQPAHGSGAAFLFERSASVWGPAQSLLPGGLPAQSRLGTSVDLSGTWAIVGAPRLDPAGTQGEVYLFDLATGGAPQPTVALTAPLAGVRVVIDDELAAATCRELDAMGHYVTHCRGFQLVGGGWIDLGSVYEAPHFDNTPFPQLHGNRLAIADTGLQSEFVQMFEWSGSWVPHQLLTSPPGRTGLLGTSVVITDSEVFVGSPYRQLPGFPEGTISSWSLRTGACAERYCFGFACPCGNDAHSGCRNSNALSAALHISDGEPSVGLDQWTLTAANTTPGQFALLFMGSVQISLPFGDGLRCVGGGGQGTYRFPPQFAPNGLLDWGPGLGDLSCNQLPPGGCIAAGQVRTFQVWYRDPTGLCGSGFNTTNGVSALFVP